MLYMFCEYAHLKKYIHWKVHRNTQVDESVQIMKDKAQKQTDREKTRVSVGSVSNWE